MTVLFVYGLFMLFYLPFFVTMLVDSFTGYVPEVKIAYKYAGTVVFINSFLNPLVSTSEELVRNGELLRTG